MTDKELKLVPLTILIPDRPNKTTLKDRRIKRQPLISKANTLGQYLDFAWSLREENPLLEEEGTVWSSSGDVSVKMGYEKIVYCGTAPLTASGSVIKRENVLLNLHLEQPEMLSREKFYHLRVRRAWTLGRYCLAKLASFVGNNKDISHVVAGSNPALISTTLRLGFEDAGEIPEGNFADKIRKHAQEANPAWAKRWGNKPCRAAILDRDRFVEKFTTNDLLIL